MGVLAHHTGCAGWTISSMDRLAMPLLGDITGSFRLFVQYHWEERIRRSTLSRHAEHDLATISGQWIILRSAHHWPDRRSYGSIRHSRLGSKDTDSISVFPIRIAIYQEIPIKSQTKEL